MPHCVCYRYSINQYALSRRRLHPQEPRERKHRTKESDLGGMVSTFVANQSSCSRSSSFSYFSSKRSTAFLFPTISLKTPSRVQIISSSDRGTLKPGNWSAICVWIVLHKRSLMHQPIELAWTKSFDPVLFSLNGVDKVSFLKGAFPRENSATSVFA